MTLYDYSMIAILLGAMGFGYVKGLAWQIASIAAIVVSYTVAVNFRDPVSQMLQAEPPWNRIGAMFILFVGCSLGIWVLYAYLSKSIKRAELKGFDRQAGALVGGIKGVLLCMVVTMFSVSLLGEKVHDSIHHSKLGPFVVRGISQVSSIVPDELAPYVDPHVESFYEQLGHDGQTPLNQYPAYQGSYTSSYNGQPVTRPIFQGNWTINQTPAQPNESGNAFNNAISALFESRADRQQQVNPTNGSNQAPIQLQAQPPTTNGDGTWRPPNLEIKVDSEDLLEGIWNRLNPPNSNPAGSGGATNGQISPPPMNPSTSNGWGG